MRAFTQEEARAHILAAHGLVDPFSDPIEAVASCVAVQTQYAASLPIAVIARTKSPKPHWDESALASNGALVKSWSLRYTLHAHARKDHALILAAVGERFYARHRRRPHLAPFTDFAEVERKVLAAIAGGPLTRAELHQSVGELKGLPFAGWGMDVMGLSFKGKLCVIGRGAEQKFCSVESEHVQGSPIQELLRRYLRSYGPATLHDFAYWTGLPMSDIHPAFNAIASEVERIEVQGLSGTRYALAGAEASGRVPGLRLLAKFDPLVMAHKDKTLFLREQDRKKVFRKAGQVEATVLADGRVAGTWRMATKGKTLSVVVEPFGKLSKSRLARLERETDRLAKGLGSGAVELRVEGRP